MIPIIYPERRMVSCEQMLAWYADAVANGEVEDLRAEAGFNAHIAALALHEAGLITLQNP